jgi:peptidoglycan/xylan/chitin deacetylase (PgdA/CDA1 family)
MSKSIPRKPLVSISLDADDLWAYMRTHGDPAWRERPSYLPRFFSLVLDMLDELGLRITFFIVGFDAARPENAGWLREITERGHEVGNHSYEHECWLAEYDTCRIDADIARAEEAIHAATGQRPLGFRGPGFSWSRQLLHVLEQRGYKYDASTLPTFLAPLARLYFLRTATLTPEERRERAALFGSFRDGLRPIRPYRWAIDGRAGLLEIPVTTMPVVRIPFHLSYLVYLNRYSRALMAAYLSTAITACRLTGVEPSFLLHPLDLLGGDEVPRLEFFPGMDLPTRRKMEVFSTVLGQLRQHFEPVSMRAHADSILARRTPTEHVPDRRLR